MRLLRLLAHLVAVHDGGAEVLDVVQPRPHDAGRAVRFDVDFTLVRPGPELGPEGYRKVGERHGLTLDPERYEQARLDALQRDPEHVHDVWIEFTTQIVRRTP